MLNSIDSLITLLCIVCYTYSSNRYFISCTTTKMSKLFMKREIRKIQSVTIDYISWKIINIGSLWNNIQLWYYVSRSRRALESAFGRTEILTDDKNGSSKSGSSLTMFTLIRNFLSLKKYIYGGVSYDRIKVKVFLEVY